ncbi:MAG: HAMP domain-containing histidine kinase [Bacteroidetes bacterium]|jgi:two-component system, sporulation sensor kinase D|nr:HAMP domain-containing histidine kinase [Bacteroidota bacterium]MBP7256533.1 HAMP domain-containing histidine kinase [Chitinophagales bacterium]MBK7640813.1 HAMP domain-containing histidine kinase [Bacteroidota bacterium]MBK8674250.1 HAMP domain-containing histidine kinase [Bacteroidota bacterium]MBK9634907.1 HAMP domain-containing histidine kinase [Bacteroidota bacterium]
MSDIYTQRNQLKKVLLFIAIVIVVFSLVYTQRLAEEISDQEKMKVEKLANTYEVLNTSTDLVALEKSLELIKENDQIPVIWADSTGQIFGQKNFDSIDIAKEKYLSHQLARLKKQKRFVKIAYEGSEPQYLYYKDSHLLRRIKWYPFYQIGLVSLFFLVGYVAYNSSKRAEQNRVWVGMAKETAHQLGTPLSSMNGWVDILRDRYTEEADVALLDDFEKDISRLELVAERFSKIGSKPDLQETNLPDLLQKTMDYIAKRGSKFVEFYFEDQTNGEGTAMLNSALFEWVIENLLKNALDAIDGKGEIKIILKESNNESIIDVIDSGKGIERSKFKTVFQPGFSTKKRGWGLGLSLCKRIIETYHHGKIFVESSAVGKGTKFRIVLFR